MELSSSFRLRHPGSPIFSTGPLSERLPKPSSDFWRGYRLPGPRLFRPAGSGSAECASCSISREIPPPPQPPYPSSLFPLARACRDVGDYSIRFFKSLSPFERPQPRPGTGPRASPEGSRGEYFNRGPAKSPVFVAFLRPTPPPHADYLIEPERLKVRNPAFGLARRGFLGLRGSQIFLRKSRVRLSSLEICPF